MAFTMANLPDREACCGCSACFAACPRHAIRMVADDEGFLQPSVDASRCVQCGRCEAVCPVLRPNPPRQPLAVYAARVRDDNIRMQSSSGGLFTALAEEVLTRNGIVFGAGWDQSGMRVVHKAAETSEALAELRGSKYVQSDMGEIFGAVKTQLEAGRQVLFTGCPCHVAGLKAFLHKDYANLLCVDLICHAVPSPKVFALYKAELELRHGAKAKSIAFRNKDMGWKHFSMALSFENGLEYRQALDADPFCRGFLRELYNRPSCHQCKFRELRSGADITLADYWNVQQRFAELDDDRGVSLILVNTTQGQGTFETMNSRLTWRPSDFADAKQCNPALVHSVAPHPKRGIFFNSLTNGQVIRCIEKALKPTIYRRLRFFVGRFLRELALA